MKQKSSPPNGSMPVFVATGLAMMFMAAPRATAAQAVSADVGMPVRFNGLVDITDCQNSPGPVITLSGALTFGALDVSLILQNNAKGTHKTSETYTTDTALVAAGGEIQIPKQPVLGGVGGNPHIWVQFMDESDAALSDPVYLGRCVQGLSLDAGLISKALASTGVTVEGCENNPGPWIYIDGDLVFTSGLKARFILQNSTNKKGGPHQAVVTRDVSLLASGAYLQIPKQPSRGGVGGNPLISLQFSTKDADGVPVDQSDVILLGRCVQLD